MIFSRAFRVFESRNYDYFFIGQIISRLGTWMQRTAVIWVVYQISHSVLMVGVATFAEQIPSFLLSPAGGITADRYNRNRIVIVTQIISAIQAILLTAFYFWGYHSLWIILSLSFVLGVVNAYDIPARQAMVNELVTDAENLPGAIAMNSSLNNFARLAGPALGGLVMAKYSPTVCFAMNAVSYLAVIYCLFRIKNPSVKTERKEKNMLKELREGLSYTRGNPEISGIISIAALVSLFVSSYNVLQPYFAKDVFAGNAATYGYINGCIGLGALVSTLWLASQKSTATLKRIFFFNLLLLGFCLILMSVITHLWLYLALCVACGFGTMSTIPICNTIVQTTSTVEMRGRVVGFFIMATMGMLPLGGLLMGWLAKIFDAQHCQMGQGFLCIIITLSFAKFLKSDLKGA